MKLLELSDAIKNYPDPCRATSGEQKKRHCNKKASVNTKILCVVTQFAASLTRHIPLKSGKNLLEIISSLLFCYCCQCVDIFAKLHKVII